MAESDEEEKEHSTKVLSDEPQEEFIEPEARPSQPEEQAPEEQEK